MCFYSELLENKSHTSCSFTPTYNVYFLPQYHIVIHFTKFSIDVIWYLI